MSSNFIDLSNSFWIHTIEGIVLENVIVMENNYGDAVTCAQPITDSFGHFY